MGFFGRSDKESKGNPSDDLDRSGLPREISILREKLRRAEESALEGKQEIQKTARTMTFTNSVLSHIQSFGESVFAVRGSLVTLAETMRNELSTMQETDKIALSASNTVSNISSNMTKMSDASQVAAREVEGLSERAGQIGAIVNAIREIADQTNLLALNAAIESARAGEQGRGFAVVADEVRKLASRTSAATQEISSLVTAIQGATQSAKVAMIALSEQSSVLSTAGDGASRNMEDMIRAFGKMEETIGASSLKGFIEVVKMDHLVFKFDVYQVLFGLSDKKADSFSDHRACRLGKWYYEGDGRTLKDKPGFRELDRPHEEVHRSGIDAIARFHEGQLDQAIVSLGTMDKASVEVLEQLERIALSGGPSV